MNEALNSRGVQNMKFEIDPVLSSRILTPEEYSELATKAPTTRHGEMTELSDGSKFFRIERTNPEGLDCVPETQHAIAMMLKGIANVADIVSVHSTETKENYHFSVALDLDDITENQNPYALGAQQILLDTLFGDTDHHIMTVNGVPDNTLDGNVQASEDSKRFYFFDFAIAFEEAFLTGRTYSQAYIKNRMQWVNQDEKSREEFQRLLGEFHERFEGPKGLALLQGIVKKSGLPVRKMFAYPTSVRIEALLHGGMERYFQNEMMRRVTFMEKHLEETPVTSPPEEEPYDGPLQ